jgi:hypothetical protein
MTPRLTRESSRGVSRKGGRTPKLPLVESRLGVAIEHHVMERLAAGASLAQIASSLRVHIDTLRAALRRRGYFVDRQAKLVRRPPRAGRSVAAR